ncbi:MAG: ferritin-like domain-containing protein [Chloroflexia bacterium]|nr:ferritin-like domain-containing protein [Chloroflexia bacterium]
MRQDDRSAVRSLARIGVRQATDDAGLNALITLEAASVTLIGVARQRAAGGDLALDEAMVGFLRASQCQDEAHYHFLASIGAVPLTATFSLAEISLDDAAALFGLLADLEAIAVGAHMASLHRFATEGDPRLTEIAYQMGAVDAQHLTLARQFLGALPANDRAFARWRFADPADAADALADLGVLREDAEGVPFPGPVERLCAGVFGLVPETTADAVRPLPAVGTPLPG